MARNVLRSIRFSQTELTAIEARAAQAGMGFSAYVRAALDAFKPRKIDAVARHDAARRASAQRQ